MPNARAIRMFIPKLAITKTPSPTTFWPVPARIVTWSREPSPPSPKASARSVARAHVEPRVWREPAASGPRRCGGRAGPTAARTRSGSRGATPPISTTSEAAGSPSTRSRTAEIVTDNPADYCTTPATNWHGCGGTNAEDLNTSAPARGRRALRGLWIADVAPSQDPASHARRAGRATSLQRRARRSVDPEPDRQTNQDHQDDDRRHFGSGSAGIRPGEDATTEPSTAGGTAQAGPTSGRWPGRSAVAEGAEHHDLYEHARHQEIPMQEHLARQGLVAPHCAPEHVAEHQRRSPAGSWGKPATAARADGAIRVRCVMASHVPHRTGRTAAGPFDIPVGATVPSRRAHTAPLFDRAPLRLLAGARWLPDPVSARCPVSEGQWSSRLSSRTASLVGARSSASTRAERP